MDHATLRYAITLLQERKTPLLVLPPRAGTDAVAAALALSVILTRLGKRPRVVAPTFSYPPGHAVLPKSEEILTDLTALKTFVITVETKRAPLQELSYDIAGTQAHIYLTPKTGALEPGDVTTRVGGYTFDAIVTLDAPSLEGLGKLYDENRDFFYRTPVLNIDHSPANERYGQVVCVDVVATSVSEIVFELFQEWPSAKLDDAVATALLAGMVSKTKSFQTPNVTPRVLAIASHLVSSGARRDEIIRNLYQTKRLSVLKLWGRALTRLQATPDQRFVWTTVSAQDLKESGADLADVPGVIDDLIANTAGAELIVVAAESGGDTVVYAAGGKATDALALLKPYQPSGTRHFANAIVHTMKPLDLIRQIEPRAIEHINAVV